MNTTQVRSTEDIEALPLRRYADAVGLAESDRLSWGSIFAGSIFGLVFQLWLTMLGVAIGASTMDPLREANPFQGLGVGSGVWLGVSVLISSFVGGWITGRLSGWKQRVETGLHGAMSWATSNFIIYAVIGTVLGGTTAGMARFAGGAADSASLAAIMQQNTNNEDATAMQDEAASAMSQGRAEVQSRTFGERARQTGDTAAKTVAGAGLGLVALMLLGLFAGIGGALTGALRPARRQVSSR